jgi:hypothetical protein
VVGRDFTVDAANMINPQIDIAGPGLDDRRSVKV